MSLCVMYVCICLPEAPSWGGMIGPISFIGFWRRFITPLLPLSLLMEVISLPSQPGTKTGLPGWLEVEETLGDEVGTLIRASRSREDGMAPKALEEAVD